MLPFEYILSVLSQLLCIGISFWVLIKVHRLAGIMLASGFTLALVQMLIMTLIPEVISFDFSKTEDPSIFNSGLIAPIWYKVLAISRTITSFLIPLGIYLVIKQKYETNT